MSIDKTSGTPGEETSPSSGRLKYEKPRITFREPLEGVAAVCDPGANGKGNPIDCLIGSS